MNTLDAEYREGRRLIDEHMKANARLSSHDLFRSCWALIEENASRFKGRATLSDMHESVWRVLVHHDFAKHFVKVRPEFQPPVRAITAPEGAAVMVTVHTGLELAIARALAAKGRNVSVIYAPSAQNSERFALYKPSSKVSYIKTGPESLLNAAVALRGGSVVLADCDHPVPENARANRVRAIRGTLFELAKRAGAELCFVMPSVDRRGHIDFRTRSMGIPPRDGRDYRQDFIAFLNAGGLEWMRWELSGPAGTSPGGGRPACHSSES